jgi:hypothetical protein
MSISRTVVAGVAAATALAVSLAGCGGHKSSTSTSGSATSATSARSSAPTSSPPAQPSADYTGLLIQATDIDAPPPNTFTGSPPTKNPNGQPGVATTFSTQDNSHSIKDTIQVLADPVAATNALNAAKGAQGGIIKNPKTDTVDVGTGGTVVYGDSPDGSRGVVVLLFTEGKAFVTLEFDGPAEMIAPPEFVRDIGQKQDAAVKKGLGG